MSKLNPFDTIGEVVTEFNIQQTATLDDYELDYMRWLFEQYSMMNSTFLQIIDTVEYYLRMILFPVSIIIQRDLPSLSDYLRVKIDEKMDSTKPRWVGTSYFVEQQEKCEMLWRFWQSKFALDSANGEDEKSLKQFIGLIRL